MPKAFIKNINGLVSQKLKELHLKPSRPLSDFKKKEKRFYALPCWTQNKRIVFLKMLISSRKQDGLSLKKEILLTKFLSAYSPQEKRLTNPFFIASNTKTQPYWLLREYLPGKIIGHHFKIYQAGLKKTVREQIIETVLALQGIPQKTLKKLNLKRKKADDYLSTLKKIEHELKLWKTGQEQGRLNFNKIYSFFEKQKKYLKESRLVFTHGDLTLANFFLSKKGLFLTDWEWSRLDNPAYDLSRPWIQTFKYPSWRKGLLTAYLKKIPLKKKTAFQQSFRLTAMVEAVSEFFGDILKTSRQTALKKSMQKTIVLTFKGFQPLINQK